MNDNLNLTMVTFRLDDKEWHGRPSETLWAAPVPRSDFGELLQLRNSPFFAKEISFLDIIRAKPNVDGEGLEFVEVVERSGHSTYMILVSQDESKFEENWEKLNNLGCTYESKSIIVNKKNMKLYAVDVPAISDIYEVYPILEQGESSGTWVFQEGHVGHRLK